MFQKLIKMFILKVQKYLASQRIFLSFKMILDKAGGMGTELAKNCFENIDNLYEFIPKSSHCKCTG